MFDHSIWHAEWLSTTSHVTNSVCMVCNDSILYEQTLMYLYFFCNSVSGPEWSKSIVVRRTNARASKATREYRVQTTARSARMTENYHNCTFARLRNALIASSCTASRNYSHKKPSSQLQAWRCSRTLKRWSRRWVCAPVSFGIARIATSPHEQR